ncbi:hypothetical protein H920_15572 [Fukomys damarensis]|uniref:Uncharacterized protein n=1 Tax=Fukomys damarensis TaxID=885580 RepID=A0A091CWJ6_FUKDA|nr:hypothetical protein H920_15572 [Fukomys damarensis]
MAQVGKAQDLSSSAKGKRGEGQFRDVLQAKAWNFQEICSHVLLLLTASAIAIQHNVAQPELRRIRFLSLELQICEVLPEKRTRKNRFELHQNAAGQKEEFQEPMFNTSLDAAFSNGHPYWIFLEERSEREFALGAGKNRCAAGLEPPKRLLHKLREREVQVSSWAALAKPSAGPQALGFLTLLARLLQESRAGRWGCCRLLATAVFPGTVSCEQE